MFYTVKLTEEIAARLSPIDSEQWPAVLQDIRAGHAWIFRDDNGTILVLRVDSPDLVVMAIHGKHGRDAMQWVIKQAQEFGLKSVRFHTKRGPAFERLLKCFRPVELERAYRVMI